MRYVLLKHERNGDFHVDFLLDCGAERLLSWQICDENFTKSLIFAVKFFNLAESPKRIIGTANAVCRRNFDHRKLYLDYEGEISNNRGHVTRIEYGNWELSTVRSDQITLVTTGRQIAQNSPTVKQWQFRPPKGFAIDTQNLSPPELLEKLPPPGESEWHLQCRLLPM
jgi:hypothetical protein